MIQSLHIATIIRKTDKTFAPYYKIIPTLIKERRFTKGIEIGVFAGGHAQAILKGTDLRLLIGIDPYTMYVKGGPPGDMKSQKDYDRMYDFMLSRLNYGNRFIHFRLPSDSAYTILNKVWNEFDFVFIDGFHSYEQVKKDLDNYSTLIKKGGIIACHDYNHSGFPGVSQAIDEFSLEHDVAIIKCPLYMVYMEKTWE